MGTKLPSDWTGASPVAYVLHWPPDEIIITTTTKPSLPDIYDTAPNIGALLLLPLLCAIGFIGNAMVCIAIATDRRLQNITNYFLFSLALADLLVCSIVMPLAILAEARHGYWTWSFAMCLLYAYSDVFLCSASIVHMSIISLDRYLGISQPLKMRNKSRTVVFMKVILVWVITLMISSPLAGLAIHDPRNILHDNQCAINNRGYMLYGSTLSFLIPLGIMVATYINTTKLLNKQASLLSQRTNDRFHNGLRRTLPHRKLGYVRTGSCGANPAAKESVNQHKASTLSYASLNAGTPGTANRTNRNAKYAFQQLRTNSSSTETEDTQLIVNGVTEPPNGKKLVKQSSVLKLQFGRLRDRTSSVINTISTKVGRRSSLQTESMELANEHKATRVLAVVFICFFICWTPFFCSNITFSILGNDWAVPPWMGSLFLWLGYISSIINPIIYTIFNRRFRQAFLRILRCQCMHSIRDPSLSYSRTHTYMPTEAHTWSNFETGKTSNNNSCKEAGNGRAYTPPAGLHRQPVTGLLSVCAKRTMSTASNKARDSPSKTPLSPYRQAVLSNAKTRPSAFPIENGNNERQNVTFNIEQTSYSTPSSPLKDRKALESIRNSTSSSSCQSKPIEDLKSETAVETVTTSQTMQISDYDNLKSEISNRAKSSSAEQVGTSSFSDNEDDEQRPLILGKHSSTNSTPRKVVSPLATTVVPKRFLLSANTNMSHMPRSVSATIELRPASATPCTTNAIKSTIVTEHRQSWAATTKCTKLHRSPSAGTEGGLTITNSNTTTTSSNGRHIRAHKVYETYL